MPAQTSYDICHNESLPFFEPSDFQTLDFEMAYTASNMSFTCEPAVPSSSSKLASSYCSRDTEIGTAADGFICDSSSVAMADDTTLSTTVEHYSSASAALNADLTDDAVSAVNLTDTNALFQQLLCSTSLLDDLDFDNSSFLDRCKYSLLLFFNV